MKKIEDNESLINNENPMSPFSFNNEDNPDLIEIKKLKKKEYSSYFIIFFLILLLILILISIIKYYFDSKNIYKIPIINPNFNKSLLDNNTYGLIKLKNGAEILLIQDPSTEISSVSVVINTGYLSDINQEGIAHLTMQSLFFNIKHNLSQNFNDYFGGVSKSINNFYTSFNFYCLNDGFYNILNNFGNNFTPLNKKLFKFYYSDILSDIDSDYNLKSENNINKEEHLIKYLVEGVYNNISEEILPEGNKEIFKDEKVLNEKIQNYFNSYYYGENIKIVLFSNLKTSLMKAYAIQAFNNLKSKISNKTEKKQNFQTKKIINYSSDDKVPYMKIIYYINGTQNGTDAYINQGYLNYLNYILKSSDKNSFYNFLKNFSIISSINVFSNITFNNIIKYTIQVNFDYESFVAEEIENVIIFIFSYIENNIKNFYNEKAFNFLKNEYDNSFIFSEKESNLENYVNQLALKLFWRKGNLDYFLYDYFLPKDESKMDKKINNLISQLTINNSIIILKDIRIEKCKNHFQIFNDCSKYHLKNNSTYFRLNYAKNDILKNIIIKNVSEYNISNITNPSIYSTSYNDLIYPNILDKNEYIPTNNILIYQNETLCIFSKLDRTFFIPKVFVNIKLFHYLSRTNGTINSSNSVNIYNYLTYYIYLKIEIKEQLREATLGGNEINVIRDDDCINIQIKAFSDIVKNIIDNILNIIYNPKVNIAKIKIYYLHLNNYLKENDIKTYWKFKIKKNYYYRDIILNLTNNISVNQTINMFENLNDSMIVYVYFYGNFNYSLLNKTSESFIKRKANLNQFMDFLGKYYNDINISNFMNFFDNITFPNENYSIYYIEKNVEERILQVFYYLGDYNKDKYIKMYLLSKMLMNNNTNIKIELKILKGLFLFFQVSNKSLSYEKLEKSIDYYFNDSVLTKTNELYEDNKTENKIQKFYYLINNFVQDINKDALNLKERAYDIINRLFYDKLPINSTNSSITIYNLKELKKNNPKNLSDLFKHYIITYFKKIDIIIGPKTTLNKIKSTIFEKEYIGKIKPLFEKKTQK